VTIPIEKEPPELYANTRVYEHCVFCDDQTDTWNKKRNAPVCVECSKKHKVAEIAAVKTESYKKHSQPSRW